MPDQEKNLLPGTRGDRPLVVLGASARALAESAARAGWSVYAADLFRDLDLEAWARRAVQVPAVATTSSPGYPSGLRTAAAGFPDGAPWCYTGGIENHPDLVDALAAERRLAGNSGRVLRALRDPAVVADAARSAGLAYPKTAFTPVAIPRDGTFLVKPLRGAGGRGIARWTAAAEESLRTGHARDTPRIWQEFVAGVPISAAYCMSAGRSRLLGASRQLVGEPWCHAREFSWCGAVTGGEPPAVEDSLLDGLDRLGAVLAERVRPVGLVGIDLIVDGSGTMSVIEINPRPTASMELYERGGTGSLARLHLAACGCDGGDVETSPSPIAADRPGARAKAVLFAESETHVSASLAEALTSHSRFWGEADGGCPAVRDLPRPGSVLAAGAPAVTVFACGHDGDDALATLRSRVAPIDALLASARVIGQPAMRLGTTSPPAAGAT
jgi:predicted ATP-grasp superfamily ATP-dependent carboligase